MIGQLGRGGRTSRRAIFTAILLGPAVSASSGLTGHRFESHEYRFEATVPDALPVCIAESSSHVHGVGTVLAGSDCRNQRHTAAFNVWADYNVQFKGSAIDSLSGHPACSGAQPIWATGRLALSIGGLKTAICRTNQADGRIEIALEAQSGRWPNASPSETAPYVNYTVNFNTTRSRFDRDFQLLMAFLQSIKISAEVDH
jgi:hypothetical protein